MIKHNLKIIFVLLFLGIFLNINCAHLSYIKDPFVDIPNFSKVDDTLYRGGQPTEEGMEILKKTGIKTIINLRNPGEDLDREKKQAEIMGIEVIDIPLSVYKIPEDEQTATHGAKRLGQSWPG